MKWKNIWFKKTSRKFLVIYFNSLFLLLSFSTYMYVYVHRVFPLSNPFLVPPKKYENNTNNNYEWVHMWDTTRNEC